MEQIFKYPRTQHIEGSRLQPGDEDLDSVPFTNLQNRFLVVEEKVDGANTGISFSDTGELLLQSRGHYLTGGRRERHFDLFKKWAFIHMAALRDVLGTRYILYGEWLYAKHTVYYDALTHYFMEFDILDKENGVFLSTDSRRQLLQSCPFIEPVRVIHSGEVASLEELRSMAGLSAFKTASFEERLVAACKENGIDVDRTITQTDMTRFMEGLYIKVEDNGVVTERYKFVRHDFMTTMLGSDSHWLSRPIVPNRLMDGRDIFSW